jgi:hypothetical protein
MMQSTNDIEAGPAEPEEYSTCKAFMKNDGGKRRIERRDG